MKLRAPTLLIKHKLWAGYGALLVILAIVAVTAFLNLESAQGNVREMVESKQPAAFDAMATVARLESASAAMGYVLLTHGDQEYRETYSQTIRDVEGLLAGLAASEYIQADAELRAEVELAQQNFEAFKAYEARMVELATDFAVNMPAVQFSGEQLNPKARSLLQYLAEMIMAEGDQVPTAERRQLLSDLNDLRYTFANIMGEMRAFTAFRSDIQVENMAVLRERANSLLDQVGERRGIMTFEQDIAYEQFKELFPDFSAAIDEMVELHGSDRYRTDAYLIRTEVGPLVRTIQDNLYFIAGSLRGDMETSSEELLSQIATTKTVVAALLIAGLIVGVLAAWLTSRAVLGPLARAVEAMNDIAQGEGDLTRALDVKRDDEIGQLASAFNLFVSKIHDVISQVKGSVAQLAAAAEQMSVITSETSEGVSRQQQETDQVATAMNEMNATAHEVARSATNTASATEEADRETKSGQAVVNRTVQAMNSLASEVERAAGVIMKVEKDSESIGTVMQVIRDIAEQTNLLALNAAIEAARAGEQGRGFAVVADEVRTLASRTQESTQEIDQVIKTLQAATREAVEVMEGSRDKAKTGVEQASQAGQSLTSISRAVDNITEMSTQIASAAEEQSAVAEEINRNVVSIADVAAQTADGTNQLAQASHELANLSSQLQHLVERFKVRG